MKRIFTIGLLLITSGILFNYGCKKDAPPAVLTKHITGSNWFKVFDTLRIVAQFRMDSTYSLVVSGNVIEEGTFQDVSSTITLNATSGECEFKTGIYNYFVEDNRVTFIPVTDSCSVRRPEFSGRWYKY